MARHGIIATLAAFVLTIVGLLLFSRDPAPATGAPFSTASTDSVPVLESAGGSVTTSASTTTVAPTTTTPPTTEAPTTTAAPTVPPTTVPPTTIWPTETLPAQPPAPIAPPTEASTDEPPIPLGGMAIPKIGLVTPLHEGIHLSTLDLGPGHWPGTAMPGEVGNAVIAAHRTSHGAEFRDIDQLVSGDEVRFATADGESRYRVTSTEVVYPNALWIVDPTPTATATLFACHPPGSVSQRIVVHLELVS